MFLSHNFQSNSNDTLLEQYGVQQLGYGGATPSYDASRFSFDFVAPSDQEITMRFVFASEEYPDYAPPIVNLFNDIFGFFVKAETDTSYQNIAMIPGTNMPVTISSINAATNTEYYLESSGISFAYNGYTIPISASFTAQAGVVYHLIIAIADIGDASYDSAVFLELASNVSQTVHGSAFFDESPLVSSQVNLYGFNAEPGAFDAVSTDVTNDLGTFVFENVEQGLYIVHVVPNNDVYPEALPVYYPVVVLWEDAVGVGIACDSVDVDGPGMIFVTGPGEISGTIGQGPLGGRASDFLPYEGVNVFLQDSASGQWRGYDISDNWGSYRFEDLSYGTYYVYPDVAGIPILDPRKVVIDSLFSLAEGINFEISDDGVFNVDGINQMALIDTGSNVEWTVSRSDFYFELGLNVKLRLGADTLVNDTLYTTIWGDGLSSALDVYNENEAELIGGFRQFGSKLYLRLMRSGFDISHKDMLYFDSNYQVGDTIRFHPEPQFEVMRKGVITSRDTFMLNGITRIRWEIEPQNSSVYPNEKFVTGIGNAKGFFNLMAEEIVDLSHISMLCYTDNEGNLSSNNQIFEFYPQILPEDSIVCFFPSVANVNNKLAPVFEIYPNPGQSGFTINQDKFEKADMIVRDLSGREHFKTQLIQENQTVQLEFLNAGVYVIELKTTSGNSVFARWIKQ